MAITEGQTNGDWVGRFADEERRRTKRVVHDVAMAAHQLEVSQFRLRTVMESLRERVRRDVGVFARQFPERSIHYEDIPVTGGFGVRRGHDPEAHLTVTPNLHTGTIQVQYVFASGQTTSIPRPLDLVFDGDGTPGWHFSHEDGHPVRTVDQLSEFLLVPVFTGRPGHVSHATQ